VRAWKRAVCGLVFAVLPVTTVAACGNTYNQQAGRDGKICVDDAACPGKDDSSESASAPAGEKTSPTPSETPSDEESGSQDLGTFDGSTDDNENSAGAGGGGGVEPVSVLLSGSQLPDGMQQSANGDSGGISTTWDAEDVTIGSETFSSGFIVRCTLFCRKDENGYFDVKLAGKYTRFDGSFGISADSTGDDKTDTLTVKIINQGTNQTLKTLTLPYGKVIPIKNLNVSKVGMLRIHFFGPLGGMRGAVGEPTVRQ